MHLDLSKNDIEFIDELPDLTDLVFVNFTANRIRDIHYDAFDRKSSIFFKDTGTVLLGRVKGLSLYIQLNFIRKDSDSGQLS